MTFPTARSASAGTQGSNSTNWTLSYPTVSDILDGGANPIEAGDLIMVNIGADGAMSTSSAISGFTRLIQANGNASACHAETFVKVADGTESGTFTYGPSGTASEQGVWRVSVMKDWHGTISGGVEVGTAGTGLSVNPNPPSFTPSWGSDDNFWRAVCAFDDGRRSVTAYPTNYTINQNSDASGGSGGAGMGSAGRNNAVATEDAGTFTISASDDWVAYTIAIRGKTVAQLSRTASDTITTITDSVNRLLIYPRTSIDTVTTVTDSLVRGGISFIRTLSETTSVSDTVTRVSNKVRTIADVITGVTDSVARAAANKVRTISDSITISDSVTRVANKVRTTLDTITAVTESVARIVVKPRTATDATAVSDTVNRVYTSIRTTIDSVSTSDAVGRVVSIFRWTEDDVSGVFESVQRAATMARSLVENIVIGVDSIVASTALVISRTVSDTVAIGADTVGRTMIMIRTLTDTTTVSDAVARAVSFVRITIDSVITSDTASRVVSFFRAATDATAVSDVVSRAGLVLMRTASDATASVSDAVIRVSNKIRTLSDTLSVSDVVQRSWAGARQAIDTLPAITESVISSTAFIIIRGVVDTVTTVTDTVDRAANMSRNLIDNITTTDTLERIMNIGRSITDTVDSVSDYVVRGGIVVRAYIEDHLPAVSDVIATFRGIPAYAGEKIIAIFSRNRFRVGSEGGSNLSGAVNKSVVRNDNNKEIVR